MQRSLLSCYEATKVVRHHSSYVIAPGVISEVTLPQCATERKLYI